MKSIYFTILLACMTLSHCKEDKEDSETTLSYDVEKSCARLDTVECEILDGVLSINSKGKFVFSSIEYRNVWHRRLHLIPCSKSLEDYVRKGYDATLYLRNFDEPFWVSVVGQYTTPDTLEQPQEFVFTSISLIDEIKNDSI